VEDWKETVKVPVNLCRGRGGGSVEERAGVGRARDEVDSWRVPIQPGRGRKGSHVEQTHRNNQPGLANPTAPAMLGATANARELGARGMQGYLISRR
jgi:hypothetical protein